MGLCPIPNANKAMYVITKRHEIIDLDAYPNEQHLVFNNQEQVHEMLEPTNLRGFIGDIGQIAEQNARMKQIIEEKDAGQPGHYYGRDVMLEGAMPIAHFMLAPMEYGGDTDWYKDDRKFQDFMKRRPVYNWLDR